MCACVHIEAQRCHQLSSSITVICCGGVCQVDSELTYPRVWLAAHWRHLILSSKCWNDRQQPSYLAFTQVLGIQILVLVCEVQSYLFRPDIPLDQALLSVGTSDSP